jgi:hypothetical protein
MENPTNETWRISAELTKTCGMSAPSLVLNDEAFRQQAEEFVSSSLHHNQQAIEKGVGQDLLLEMFRDCSFPRAQPTTDLNRKIYQIAVEVYADLESGKAFEDSYLWPKLPNMRVSIKRAIMKVWHPKDIETPKES